MAKIPQYLLNLTGEYRVRSELTKRGVFATVTYGNRKSVDVYAISDRRERALKIEVKTSQPARQLRHKHQPKGPCRRPHSSGLLGSLSDST